MTIISHSRNFIFVCPRKVASTTLMLSLTPVCTDEDVIVRDVLDTSSRDLDSTEFDLPQVRNAHTLVDSDRITGGQRHIPPERIRKTVGDRVWDEYFKFTVVRNPWDWFVSLYCWKLGGDWLLQRRSHHRSLLGFLRLRYRLCRTGPNYLLGRHRANVEIILKRGWFDPFISEVTAFSFLDGRAYADYYIRFERLAQDHGEVCRRLRLPRHPLPKTRDKTRDRNREYREYYTDWSREYIARQCRPVIDAFGYRF